MATGLVVLVVAAISAAISYGHIYDLTVSLHQSVLAACLMPVAIDGLIVVGSVVLLQSGSRLGWLGVGPGLALSIFANVESGIGFGALSAVWAGIPALSFFLATFIFERWLKAQAKEVPVEVPAADVPSVGEAAGTVAEVVPTAHVSTPETVAATVPEETAENGPSVSKSVSGGTPAGVPVGVPHVAPVAAVRARGQARRRSPKQSAPERVFAAEIERGELPSLREVKRRAACGTPRAREIQRQLAEFLQEAPEVA